MKKVIDFIKNKLKKYPLTLGVLMVLISYFVLICLLTVLFPVLNIKVYGGFISPARTPFEDLLFGPALYVLILIPFVNELFGLLDVRIILAIGIVIDFVILFIIDLIFNTSKAKISLYIRIVVVALMALGLIWLLLNRLQPLFMGTSFI